jgi:folate-binding Fe-S cluster repair protein YgfZ
MANLELIGGVSFTKGCYPGQEVVARTKYLGKVKRRTYRAHINGGCPLPGTDLFSPDLPEQSCGKVIQTAPSPSGGCELLASMLMSSAEAGDVRVAAPMDSGWNFLPYARIAAPGHVPDPPCLACPPRLSPGGGGQPRRILFPPYCSG